MGIIEFKDVSFQYPNGFSAVENVSFEINEGEAIAIIGQNGAGKTTTVKMINGLLKPTHGTVLIDGMDTKDYTTAQLSKIAGYVFQNPDDQIFHNNVEDEIRFGPKKQGLSEEEIVKKTEWAAKLCGLSEQMQENPYNLIAFQHEAYTKSARLTITPEPDTLIRVFMAFKPLSAPVEIAPQTLEAPARTGFTGTVEDGLFPSTYRVKWDIVGDPKVSILIPNKDHTDDLEKCLHSLWAKTSWENFEVIVVENNSTDPATFSYYEQAKQRYDGLQVVTWPQKGFNFSAINNFGRQYATGEYLLLLNNDVEVRNADWLTELLRQCAHPGGAAVCGAMLFYPDDTIQHAGVITGLGGYAGHSHKYKKAGGSGYMFRAATVQDFSAVTGACLLVKTSVWDEMGGLDEAFAVAFNDVDFCLRVREAGYRIVWTPYAQLTHYESKSRGGDEKDPVKARRFASEQQRLYDVHGKANILDDPYYNSNLTRDREDFSESDDLRSLKEGRVSVRWR